jgi:mannitol/fructose-specific phosphotransferase system IIA component (Ntr-type)
MDIKEFLAPSDTLIDVRASDKTRLLQELTRRAATILDLPAERISTEILKREELGSTGTGGGVALPHARIEGLKRSFGILARLNSRSTLRRSMAGESILYSCFSSRPTRRRTSSRRLHRLREN